MIGLSTARFAGGTRPSDGGRGAYRPSIQARYDNATTTNDNKRNWWAADYLSAKSANNFQVRLQLRKRSRYEVSNNPWLYGVCNSNADDLIDVGPTLQCTSPNAAYNRQIETAWNEWAAEVGLVEKLRTLKLAKTVDGEGFLVLKTVTDLYNSVKLFPVDIEADQVTTPAPADLRQLWVDGMELHPITQRPNVFHVLKHHPGDFFFPDMNPLKVERVQARHVIHWFNKFRPGQVRGVPTFTSALDLFTELRAFRKAVLKTAQLQASLTAVIETMAPADTGEGEGDDDPESKPFQNVPIDPGAFTCLPGGAKMQAFTAAHPAATYEMFLENSLAEACRPMAYPLNLVLGSRKFNFSSSKLDHTNYRQSLRVERKDCERIALEALFAAWFEEARWVPKLLPAGAVMATTPHEWHWPGFPSLDPVADTQAILSEIAGGLTTFQQYWASRGCDWKKMFAQLDVEKQLIEKYGFQFGEPMKKTDTQTEDAGAEAANAA